jgi:hypothetical protein
MPVSPRRFLPVHRSSVDIEWLLDSTPVWSLYKQPADPAPL